MIDFMPMSQGGCVEYCSGWNAASKIANDEIKRLTAEVDRLREVVNTLREQKAEQKQTAQKEGMKRFAYSLYIDELKKRISELALEAESNKCFAVTNDKLLEELHVAVSKIHKTCDTCGKNGYCKNRDLFIDKELPYWSWRLQDDDSEPVCGSAK